MSKHSECALKKWAYLGDFDDSINALAGMARSERWDYTNTPGSKKNVILENYIFHTFDRLRVQRRDTPDGNFLYETDENLCFNTGLFTPNFEPIFALCKRNDADKQIKWKFNGFYKESAAELRKISPLPERASYFDRISDLMFDTRLDVRINIDHILDDERNKARIPEVYRNAPNLPMLFRAAIDYAKIRIKENYKAAVPQYYHGKIQFLLPISLGDPKVVDILSWKNTVFIAY